MEQSLTRFARLVGENAIFKLKKARVLVFGLGGVGGHAAEALARSGVGTIGLVDNDTVSESNINRQLVATYSTVGKTKVEVMEQRIRDIAPLTNVHIYPLFFSEETAGEIDLASYDYIIDAIDTVKSKLLLIEKANALGVPLISCMGTGNKMDPSRLTVTDIYKTSGCPLARVIRSELKKRKIPHLKVVYSTEPAMTPTQEETQGTRHIPASSPFVPPAAGLLLAGEVVKALI